MKTGVKTLLALVFITFSCRDTGRLTALKGQRQQITAKDIANYHNLTLKIYYKLYKDRSVDDFEEIQSRVIALLQRNYPKLMHNYAKNQIMNSIDMINRKLADHWSFNSFLQEGSIMMIKDHYVSKEFATDIRNLTLRDEPLETKLRFLNSYPLRHALSANDTHALNIYKSVLVASNQYWSIHPKSNATESNLNRGSWIIAADAFGAIVGSAGDGVGSIIVGAVLSIIASEALPEEKEKECMLPYGKEGATDCEYPETCEIRYVKTGVNTRMGHHGAL